jgi:hypothetical protein
MLQFRYTLSYVRYPSAVYLVGQFVRSTIYFAANFEHLYIGEQRLFKNKLAQWVYDLGAPKLIFISAEDIGTGRFLAFVECVYRLDAANELRNNMRRKIAQLGFDGNFGLDRNGW